MFRQIVGRNDMTIRNIAYTALVGAAAVAFIIGSAVPSEAAKKKKAAAAPAPQPPACWANAPGPVCATKGGLKFTYINSCYAAKDGATSAKAGACKEAKAKKGGGKKKAAKKK
jgi:hypothetical protein